MSDKTSKVGDTPFLLILELNKYGLMVQRTRNIIVFLALTPFRFMSDDYESWNTV